MPLPNASKRLAYLEKVTEEGSTDPFPWYGLALEYRNLERLDESLQTFTTLPNNGNTWSSHQMMLALRKLSITLVLLAGKLSPLAVRQAEKVQIRLFHTNSS